MPEVIACHLVSDDADYFLMVVVPDLEQYCHPDTQGRGASTSWALRLTFSPASGQQYVPQSPPARQKYLI
jgi:hypothetical protein